MNEPAAEVLAEENKDLLARHQAEIPEWGHLPAAMRLKQAAVERLGVQSAFQLCRSRLGIPGADILKRRRIVPLHDAVRAKACFYRRLWAGGNRFERPPPIVLGESNHGPLPGTGRAAWLACIEDASARSRSALIFSGEVVLMDFEGEEYASVTDIPQFDPAVLHGTREELWTMEPASGLRHIDEAFVLFARNAVDFGHWLTEYLPRYVLAVKAGLPAHVPLLVDPVMPRSVREFLAVLVPPGTPIITVAPFEQVHVGKLWCASNPIYSGFYPAHWGPELWSHLGSEPRNLSTLIAEWLRLLGGMASEATGRDRIYFARKPGNLKKKLLNHAAIESLAIDRGFEVIYPEDLPLLEQIRLAHHARMIIAPEGSNSLLSWFAQRGAKACILSPPYTLPLVDVNAILLERGVELTVFTGADLSPEPTDFCRYWSDYALDEGSFGRFLDRWLAPA